MRDFFSRHGARTTHQRAEIELSAYEESSRDLAATSLDTRLPVIVVSHGRRILPGGALGDKLENDWDLHQREFVSRFKNGRVLIAQGSGHNIPLDEPDLRDPACVAPAPLGPSLRPITGRAPAASSLKKIKGRYTCHSMAA